jgi:hypothetical protein
MFIEFLETFRAGILIAHTIGFALGVGGATVNDFLFFKFLRDLKISHFEAKTLNGVSKVIWLGLIILIISGLGLYLPDAERLNQSSKFLTKMVVVAIILANGIALNLIVSPRLQKISFEKKHSHASGELRRLRKIAFALGSVSFVSWYSALALGSLRDLPYSFLTVLSAYLLVLAAAVSISQLVEYLLSKRRLF